MVESIAQPLLTASSASGLSFEPFVWFLCWVLVLAGMLWLGHVLVCAMCVSVLVVAAVVVLHRSCSL